MVIDPTSDLGTEVAAKATVQLVTEIFRTGLKGLASAEEWMQKKSAEYDPLGIAARMYAHRMEERYNRMRIFGMTEPVPLRDIYVRVNILEKITASRQQTIEELERFFDRDRQGFGVARETRSGIIVIDHIDNMVVLGKPGAGKTTFLKYVALNALEGKFSKSRLPVFISLKDWSGSKQSFSKFILTEFDTCGFPNAGPFVERMLEQGKCLLLLDGLDEVSHDPERAVQEIRRFVDKYSGNKFVLSCRVAAYNYVFESFVDVEMADFNDQQISAFVRQWFHADAFKEELFLEKLSEPENRRIRELARTPLLLTMLCIAFEEVMDFPSNRSELYKEALDALLKRWDASRSINRDQVYRGLSLRRKETMLSHVAVRMFENNEHFIPQRVLESYIGEFLEHLPEADHTHELDREVVLKAIEAQHGLLVERARKVYSFSHLTFQEYFTARYLVDNEARNTIQLLVVNHLFDERWREVTALAAGMLTSADDFLRLIQERLEDLIRNEFLHSFLAQVYDLVKPTAPFHPAICRSLAIYYTLDLRHLRMQASALGIGLTQSRGRAISLTHSLGRYYSRDKDAGNVRQLVANITRDRPRSFAMDLFLALDLTAPLAQSNGASLTLSAETVHALDQLLTGTSVLLDCLASDSYVKRDLRQELLDGLLGMPTSFA
jgi:predicted NACHT family NTPase